MNQDMTNRIMVIRIGQEMTKSYFIKFKKYQYLRDPNLIIDRLSELRFQEIIKEENGNRDTRI